MARILVIDDEKDILDLLSRVLEDEGYETIAASDGMEGLQLFEQEKPDLVITDMRMPRKDGMAVLKAVKKSNPDVDVIVLTGFSDEKTAIQCLKIGSYDYLLKPLEDIDLLVAAVQRAINKRDLNVRNHQLIRQLEELSIKDPLTGLYNYRYLKKCMAEELIRAERYSHPFGILMIDIDHFKAINDTYGHLFGDHILRKVSEIMIEESRSVDSVFRYGGEEFVIMMPETAYDGAVAVARRVLRAIGDKDFLCDGKKAKVTVSIGGAMYPQHATDQTALFNQADQALYRAKHSGRNRMDFDPA